MNEQRRAPRKRLEQTVTVTDVISGQPLGQLGNLSSHGMLLISPRAPRSDAVYQVRLPLPPIGAATLEIGIQEQWHDEAKATGQVWAGYRIIALGSNETLQLEQWLAQA